MEKLTIQSQENPAHPFIIEETIHHIFTQSFRQTKYRLDGHE